MHAIRKAEDRGHANFGWLDSRHTFSFGHYRDAGFMGFGPLRVINDDRVAPSGGFDTHPHADMEIISYVLEGALAHKDSLGTGSVIRPGDVQRMSAGTGIRHSEFNASDKESVHFLQIWIIPDTRGVAPSYEQINVPASEKEGAFRLIASKAGGEGVVGIHQDVNLYAAIVKDGETLNAPLKKDRLGWLHVASGEIRFGDTVLKEGDGVALAEEDGLTVAGTSAGAEILFFDMVP